MTYLKEDDEDLVSLPAEDLLLKWANWHLKQSGSGISIDSFDSENSLAYLFLMNHLNPSLNTLDSITEKDALKRAQVVVNQASVFGCDILSPEDIVSVKNFNVWF